MFLLCLFFAVSFGLDMCLPTQFKQVGFCHSATQNVVRHVYWDFPGKRFRLDNSYNDGTPEANYLFFFDQQVMYIDYPSQMRCQKVPFKVPMTAHCPLKNVTVLERVTIAGQFPATVYGDATGNMGTCNLDFVSGYCVPFNVYFAGGEEPPSLIDSFIYGHTNGNVSKSTLVEFTDFVPKVEDDDFVIPPECL